MNRLQKLMAASCLGVACAGFQGTVLSLDNPGYEIINPPLTIPSPGKITVVEFFSYGCPHCFVLDPELHEWEKGLNGDIEFVREAPPLNEFWKFRSQAFYAAQLLGVTDRIHHAYFNAIHREGRKLKRRKPILEFIGELGLDVNAFAAAMDSDEVKTRMDRALALAKAADVSGVPTLMINGKYKTGPRIAGEQRKVVDVIDTLIEKERQ